MRTPGCYKSWTPNCKKAWGGLSWLMLFFFFPCVHYSAWISSPPIPKHRDVQVTRLCIPAYSFTGQHSKTPAELHCTFPAFSCSQAYAEEPFNGTSFKILLGSETRREKPCQGSSTELLAPWALLAPPFTPPISSSPSFKRVSYCPQSISTCVSPLA